MGAFHESRPSSSSKPDPEQLLCPEDVDWIFDVDTLDSAGGEALIRMYGLEEAPSDGPHYPFSMSSSSALIWDQALRKLALAAGESHVVLTAHSNLEAQEIVFYSRVAGFRDEGMPRIAATFQRIDRSSFQSVADNIRKNWLYLLHEIKNPLSILKASEDLTYNAATPEEGRKEAARVRRFAVSCLEDHLRNGVFLATEDSRMIPNKPEPLDLKLFFEEVHDTFRVLLEMQDNTMELNLDIGAYQVARVDKALLSQIMGNLLLNKINHLEKQVLTLDASLSSTRNDGSGTLLVITIEDEGPAFPDHVLQEIDKEPDLEGLLNVQRGSGLGLPICRRIASVMGGEIRFYNDPPKTRIRIWIPLT